MKRYAFVALFSLLVPFALFAKETSFPKPPKQLKNYQKFCPPKRIELMIKAMSSNEQILIATNGLLQNVGMTCRANLDSCHKSVYEYIRGPLIDWQKHLVKNTKDAKNENDPKIKREYAKVACIMLYIKKLINEG